MNRLALAIVMVTLQADAAYHVVRRIPIGGTGGWDYLAVDSGSHRLYVSHADRVEVIDTTTGKIAGAITGLSGVHGIAVAPKLDRGFISSGRSNTVTIFDTKTLATIKVVKTTGDNPDAILYDPFMKRVWTFNGRGKNATAFDTDGLVLATVEMGGKPEFAQSDERGHIFVNVEDTNEIAVIDAKAMTVERRIALAPCDAPSGLAIDRGRDRLYTVCENKVMEIINYDGAGKIVGSAEIGAGVDGAAADPKHQLAFASSGEDGSITIVDTKSMKAIGSVATARGARTIAIDYKTGHLFVSTAKYGETPAPTADRPRPRPAIIEGTFEVIELAP